MSFVVWPEEHNSEESADQQAVVNSSVQLTLAARLATCVQHRSAVKTKKHRAIPVRALQFLVKHKRKDKGRKTEYTDAL